MWTSFAPASRNVRHPRAGRRAAHDRIVHHDDAFARDHFLDEIEFHAHAKIADELARLQERAAHVVIADEGVAEGDPAFLGESHRRPIAAVGHGNDEVGFDGMLAGELAAEVDADLGDVLVVDVAVGPREIHELENAECVRLLRVGPGIDGAEAVLVDDDDFAGRDVADVFGVDQVERAGFAGKHPGGAAFGAVFVADAASRPSTSGRKPNGSRTPMSSSSPMMTSEYAP